MWCWYIDTLGQNVQKSLLFRYLLRTYEALCFFPLPFCCCRPARWLSGDSIYQPLPFKGNSKNKHSPCPAKSTYYGGEAGDAGCGALSVPPGLRD
jgi:hypothetical protein